MGLFSQPHVFAIMAMTVQGNIIGIFHGMISLTTVPVPSLCMIFISPRHIILSLCRIFARAMCGLSLSAGSKPGGLYM